MNKQELDRKAAFWSQVYVATASQGNDPVKCKERADEALKAMDEKFDFSAHEKEESERFKRAKKDAFDFAQTALGFAELVEKKMGFYSGCLDSIGDFKMKAQAFMRSNEGY